MKIILTVHQFLPEHTTGTELITYYLACEMRKRGHEVLIVTGSVKPGDGGLCVDTYSYDDFTIHCVRHVRDWRTGAGACEGGGGHPRGGFRLEYDDAAVGGWFRDFLRNEKPDLVHCIHLSRLSAAVIDACAACATPCFFTATDFWAVCPYILLRLPDGSLCAGPQAGAANCVRHVQAEMDAGRICASLFTPPPGPPGNARQCGQQPEASEGLALPELRARAAFLRQRFGKIARVLVPSQMMRATLIANGFDAAAIRYVPYGIPVEQIERGADKGRPGPLRVGYMGQIAEHKGCHVLAQAANLLPDVPLRVRFHGDFGQNPEYAARLRGLFQGGEAVGGDRRMEAAGAFAHRDVSAVLGEMDVLVCPSLWYENTPLVIYEALAAGVPVVATDLPGMAEAIKPEVNGLLFPMGDAAALAAVLRRLAGDRALVARLSAHTQPPLSAAQHAARVEEIYREALGAAGDPRYAAAQSRGLHYTIETPLHAPVEVGRGTSFILEGWAFSRAHRIRRLEVELGSGEQRRRIPVIERGNARKDVLQQYDSGLDDRQRTEILLSGFWVPLPLEPAAEERAECFRLAAHLDNGDILRSPRHWLRLKGSGKDALRSPPRAVALSAQPRVCICMAAYNPTEAMFRRQIESIRAQDYENWICLIQDDWSSGASRAGMERVLAGDRRFVLERNERNLGFYGNFERVLRRVPADCQLVGLADQDDHWYPDKLSRLVAAFDSDDVTLAYSDMRIVDDAGRVVSDTYWTTRANNYDNFEALFFANTITGAASLFRAALLPRILPFPERHGMMYHDWWIAVVALAVGRIAYIDAPLYDYFQHDGNVIGWSSGKDRVIKIGEFIRSEAYRRELAQVALHVYNTGCKALAACIQMLPMRVPDSPRQAELRRLAALSAHPLRTLAAQRVRVALLGRVSGNREANLLMAHTLRRMLNGYFAAKMRRTGPAHATVEDGISRQGTAEPTTAPARLLPVGDLERRRTPLTLKAGAGEPVRINMLLGAIDFRHFFGGYIGVFHLARRLARGGAKVRLVTIDDCANEPAAWRGAIGSYSGLEDIFDLVEVELRADRGRPLPVSPRDRWIATSCWSAWLADAAARELGRAPFVFMIQEYEPFFVPHGAYYALSHAAYGLKHFALFSTELLREFFRAERFGVYAESIAAGEARSIAFHNAVLSFDVRAENLRRRTHGEKRKFLFYCRPEAHAQRNLFELGVLALRRAVAQGALDPAVWEFFGVGTTGDSFVIPLGADGGGRKAQLVALPKMSLDDYAAHLPDFDLGMSLMYTPHPSLVPLEMAAAGLVTVTNSYANKTAAALRAISRNLEVGEPTIEGLAAALGRASARVDDIADRVAASHINWPTSWDEALNPALMERLLRELGTPGVATPIGP